MKRLLLPLFVLCVVGCKAQCDFEQQSVQEKEIYAQDLKEEDLLQGTVVVYVSEEFSAQIDALSDENGVTKAVSLKSMANTGFDNIKPMFERGGRFDARRRSEGLHRWYEVRFPEDYPLTRAGYELQRIPGVEQICFTPKMHIVGDPQIVEDEQIAQTSASTTASSGPFDDPYFDKQWHYYNHGQASSSLSGCDINVVPVWKSYTTGKNDVIVSVVDGGIDWSHEDLAANMWHNPEGKGNGIYGKNFANDDLLINAETHGTHVAGTIAAVNNNGVGVCGVAGGNAKSKNTGVKLMSCQIFDGNKQGNGASAIVWGADHGAVISQNSWGYTNISYTPDYLKSAIDYFTKYAGMDENGKQEGPMAGGLVIFAAGNDESDMDYTACCEPALAVGSVGADYRRAYYSNYGPWVDIAAPGGDVKKGNQIYSTFPGNSYGYLQGTSMACPHVSGVAALVVSQFEKVGFTNTELRKRLVSNVTDISAYAKNLGSGLVNAYKAIAASGGKAPEVPSSLSLSVISNTVKFSVKVPKDPDDKVAYAIKVYYSEGKITDRTSAKFGLFYVGDLGVGSVLEGEISGLDFNKEYYFAASAIDLAGNESALTSQAKIYTRDNDAPVIVPLNGTEVTLRAYQTVCMKFECSDPNGHYFSAALEPGSTAAYIDTTDYANLKFYVNGLEADPGKYQAKIVVSDIYGLADSVYVDYTIIANVPPKANKTFENKIYSSKAAITTEYSVSDYFIDEDGEPLVYAFTISDPTVVNMVTSKGQFLLTPMNYGTATITVTAVDAKKASAYQSFKVLVRDGSQPVDIYPNPVHDYLYVRTSQESEATLKLVNEVGGAVFEESLTITPFDPAKVDVSKLPGGIYSVILEYNGETINKNIVKL